MFLVSTAAKHHKGVFENLKISLPSCIYSTSEKINFSKIGQLPQRKLLVNHSRNFVILKESYLHSFLLTQLLLKSKLLYFCSNYLGRYLTYKAITPPAPKTSLLSWPRRR